MLVRPDSLIVAVSADLLGESDISPPIWRTSLRAQSIRKGFQTPLVRADNRANGRSLIAGVRSLSMALGHKSRVAVVPFGHKSRLSEVPRGPAL